MRCISVNNSNDNLESRDGPERTSEENEQCSHTETTALRGFFSEVLAVKCDDCGVIA
jgi:hypothetical protein